MALRHSLHGEPSLHLPHLFLRLFAFARGSSDSLVISDQVDDSEVVSLSDNDVNCVIEARKDEGSLALENEVDVVDGLALEVHVLIFLVLYRYEHGTDPGHERQGLVSKERYFFVDLVVDL